MVTPEEVKTEVLAKAQRRRFTADDRKRILAEADACTQRGELSALLRREGIYSSTLSDWRRARRKFGEAGLESHKRGRPPKPKPDPAVRELEQLKKENARLRMRAERAEALVELQKKVAALLGTPLASNSEDP